MQYFPVSTGRFKIIVHRVAAEEFSHLNRRLHNLNLMDWTLPRISSNILVHQRKGSATGFRCTDAVMCCEKRLALLLVFGKLAGMNYKIVRASIEYPGPCEFLKGRANKSEDFAVGSRGKDEWEKSHRVLHVAIKRGCPEVSVQLIVTGPSEELLDDLMRSLRENGLFRLTGGQVYRDGCLGVRHRTFLSLWKSPVLRH